MPRFLPEPPLPYTDQTRTAVLLLNLGTPDAPTAQAVKPYLSDFLSDQRVVELPKLLWQPILRGLILTLRPKKVRMPMKKSGLKKARPYWFIPHAKPKPWANYCRI